MKKTVFRLFAAGALGLACSCIDNDGDFAAYTDFVTVRTTVKADYYFLLDDGKTLYPSDRERVGVYEAVDGQRAQIFFSLLPETTPGYDYSAALYEIRDIYTGQTLLLSGEELAQLPDDMTSLYNAWLRKSYLTLQIAYPVTDNSKHNFVLACVEPAADGGEAQADAEYLEVELRHDAAGDITGPDRVCCISFPLEPLSTLMQGRKGLSLRVRTQHNGTKKIEIDMR